MNVAGAAVRPVPARIVRRVRRAGVGLTVASAMDPDRLALAVPEGPSLQGVVERDELGLPPRSAWPSPVVLLARPDASPTGRDEAESLREGSWRLLFLSRVRLELEASGRLDPAEVEERIERIGRVAFEEARAVLREDGLLDSEADDRAAYAAFAAAYLELHHFAPGLLPDVFPGLEDGDAVEAMLAEDVDSGRAYSETRLHGLPDPAVPDWVTHRFDDPVQVETDEDEPADEEAPRWTSRPASIRLSRRADEAEGRGNLVRAATLRARAARGAPPRTAARLRQAALGNLEALADRVAAMLGLGEAEAGRWGRALPALLDRASRGYWSPEARLLYDLQKASHEQAREVFAVDLIEWARSLGRRPIRRPLPVLRDVRTSHHVHAASRRLRSTRLGLDDRQRLADLLRQAVEIVEEHLRERVRPPLEGALEAEGLIPRNVPEGVARRKLVEELLDKVVGRGFLTLGDLRDAISSNALKLPDLAGPREFFAGDRLLRVDRELAVALDGVYRRGEFYMRWLQRVSSLAFGTRIGRLLTRFVALPYLGAFVALEGMQHIVGFVTEYAFHFELHLMTSYSVAAVGTMTMLAINSREYREALLRAIRRGGAWIRWAAIDLPARLLRLPWLRRLLDSPAARALWRFGAWPMLLATPIVPLGLRLGLDRGAALSAFLVGWGVIGVSVNTRPGRDAQELAADAARRAWHQFYADLLPGLYRMTMELFHRFLEVVDKFLYAVDEWLRFRAGQPKGMLAAKAILGVFWFLAAYVVRFYVNLLIEPQVNPIKHFPVVTVSHKLMLPLIPEIFRLMVAFLSPLGGLLANTLAGVTVFLLPGVFGFLVWELKENWRLYEANRSRQIRPVVFGSHGETMARMLRPGFHSGTLPKTFARLRRSERRALAGSEGRGVVRHRDALHHAEELIRHFFERNALALLERSRALAPLGVTLGAVEISTNRVLAEFRARDAADSLWLSFECRDGWIVAGVAETGWVDRLTDARRRALTTLVAGLYKMADVQLVHEQIRSRIGRAAVAYTFSPEGLVIVPPPAGAEPPRAVYPLDDDADDHPRIEGDADADDLPELAPDRLRYREVPVAWSHWVDAWERDADGAGHPNKFIIGYRLLPQPDPAARKAARSGTRRR